MMKNVGTPSDERLSAMVDGEFDPVEMVQALGAVAGDANNVRQWHAYHVVGDVLRSAELAAVGRDLEFLRKFEQQLAQEPVYPRPQSTALQATLDGVARNHSANAGSLRWKLVAGVACSALVMVVSMGQWQQPESQPGVQLSSAPSTKPAAIAPPLPTEAVTPVMIRDPELDRLLAAHQQLGGHSALQRSSGFLRNATFEVPVR
jgi:sigma-E factor negative regulatory protein RseA